MAYQIGNRPNPAEAKKAALEAARRASASVTSIVQYRPPEECSERVRNIFDDSGSMHGYIGDAKKGLIEYLRNTTFNQTAVAVHFMNSVFEWSGKLTSDLPQLAVDIQACEICEALTPFHSVLLQTVQAAPVATRIVLFTDGEPTDELPLNNLEAGRNYDIQLFHRQSSVDYILEKAAGKIPVDTVFFGPTRGAGLDAVVRLKYISDKTGGYFLHFDPAKTNFASAFKYLAPAYRAMLSDSSFRAAIEKGEKR